MEKEKLIFATGNAGKMKEIKVGTWVISALFLVKFFLAV